MCGVQMEIWGEKDATSQLELEGAKCRAGLEVVVCFEGFRVVMPTCESGANKSDGRIWG